MNDHLDKAYPVLRVSGYVLGGSVRRAVSASLTAS